MLPKKEWKRFFLNSIILLCRFRGKDSAVMLHLMIDYMRKNNIRKKIYVYHLDYEGQYSATTDFVTEMLTTNLDIIEPLWCCLPIAAQSAVSMFTDH